MDPLIDPQMAEWLRQKKEALGAAYEADKAAQEDETRRALLMQFAQSYANQRPTPVSPRQVNDARSRFGAEYGLEKDARGTGLDVMKFAGSMAEREAARAAAEAAKAEERAFRSGERDEDRAARLAEREDERKWREGQAAKDRELRRETLSGVADSRAALADQRAAEAERKQREEDAKHYISDNFTATGKPLLPAVQADLQKRASATDVVLDNAKQVEDILTHGGPAVWGQRATELSSLINNIWTELKDIKNLGVLAGPDMGILQGIVADPSSLDSVLKDAAAVRQLLPQIQKFQARMKGDLVRRVSGYGAKPVEGGAYYEAPAAAPAQAKRPQRTVNGETREWNGSAWVPPGSP